MPGGPIKKKGSEFKPENDASSRVVGRERRGSDPKEREKEKKETKSNVSRLEKRAGREMKPLDPTKIEIPVAKVESKV